MALYMKKATSFAPFLLITNLQIQDASSVIEGFKQTRKQNIIQLLTLLFIATQLNAHMEGLRPRIINFTSPLQKNLKKRPKAPHLTILLPSLPNSHSQFSNPSTQSIFQKGNYSVTFNPLFNKSYAQILCPPIQKKTIVNRQQIQQLPSQTLPQN